MKPKLHYLNTAADSNVQTPLKESPSQTAGPYVHIGCLPNFVQINGVFKQDLTRNKCFEGDDNIEVFGYIFQGNNEKGKDIMVECWQANGDGDLGDGIWQRTPTDLKTGKYHFRTIVPGGVHDNAPCLNFWIVARGINLGLHTKMYFEDHDNGSDPILNLVPANRRSTLIGIKTKKGYRFDIHLQGTRETVFFND